MALSSRGQRREGRNRRDTYPAVPGLTVHKIHTLAEIPRERNSAPKLQ